jgi:hypothetical protein
MSSLFPDPLLFRLDGWRGDSAIFELQHCYSVCTSMGWIVIPAGFRSDGLSIPPFAWPFVGPANGPAFGAGLLHDYLYSRDSTLWHNHPREVCDDLFKEAMFNLGISWPRRELIFRAVRIFGGKHFKR